MYHTTDVAGGVKRGSRQNSGGEGATADEKFSLKFSYAPYFFRWKKYAYSETASTVSTAKGLRDCFTTCILLLMALCLTFVIVLWVVALIADGPDETHSCVILWPIVAGVLIISVLFIFLGGLEYCLKELHRRRNLREAKARSPLGLKDSLQVDGQKRKKGNEIPGRAYIVYQQHICVTCTYFLLTLSLLCVMIASVAQYFTLDSSCYEHLQINVEELLLGYEVLAYMSAVVLSLLSCILVCLLFGVIVKCIIREPRS